MEQEATGVAVGSVRSVLNRRYVQRGGWERCTQRFGSPAAKQGQDSARDTSVYRLGCFEAFATCCLSSGSFMASD